MLSDQDFQRFLDLREYVGWTEDDDACSEELFARLTPYAKAVIEDFYAEVRNHPASWRVITGGDRQIARLSESLARWLRDTLQAKHDRAYAEVRWRIGYRHVEIGLDQLYVNAAFSRIRMRLTENLCVAENLDLPRRIALQKSLNKRLDLDLAMMTAAYQAEYQSRQIPVDHARLRQQKRLAQLSRDLLADADLLQICDQTVSYLAEALQSDLAEYVRWDAAHARWDLLSAVGWPDRYREQPGDTAEGESFWERLREQAGVVVIDDWQLQDDWSRPEALANSRVVSSLLCVVRDEGDVDGVLGAHFQNRRQFLASDLDYIASLGNLLSNAIHRKRIARQKLENVRQLRRLVDLLPAGAVYVVGETLQVNQAVELMTGYSREELSTRSVWDRLVRSDSVQEQTLEIVDDGLDGMLQQRELEIIRRDGQQRLISQIKFESSTDEIWLLNDVTESAERRRKELQAERLAAIGQMITGLTHESRNALQRIQACTEILELQLEGNEPALKLLARSQQAQNDLQLLFDEVRNYASPLTLDKQPCPINRIFAEAWDQTEPLRNGREARLAVHLDPPELTLQVDRFRLVQVFRNFFENSLAATDEPVQITLEGQVTPSENDPDKLRFYLVIRDNGPGLSETVARHIFDPFFTTKAKGSGLGMAIAARLVAAHQGSLTAIGHPDGGAEFRLELPAP